MKRFYFILCLMLGIAAAAKAQTYTQHLQEKQPGKASVVVTQSSEIDQLVNNANVSARAQEPVKKHTEPAHQDNTPTKKQNTQDAEHTKHNTQQHNGDTATHANHNKEQAHHEQTSEVDTEPVEVDMRKKVMRRSDKVNGYRVQVFAGGNTRNDKIKAQNAGNAVKQAFPSQPVYVHFYSPRWICRMGNYRTYEEASAILHQVKKLGYKQACIVSGKITMAY